MILKAQQIFCPVDFDDCSWQALKKAAFLAKSWQSDLRVFHVVAECPYEGATVSGALVDLMGRWEKEALRQLEAKVQQWVPTQEKVSCQVAMGVPYSEILSHLQEKPADLVVLGPDRDSLASLVLGRQAETILRHSLSPVWIEKGHSSEPAMPQAVALLTDFSMASLEVASQALAWARAFGAKLYLVHILEPLTVPAFSLMDPKDYEKSLSELAYQRMEAFQEALDLKGLDWERQILHGSVEQSLQDLVASKGIELLILGTQGRTAMAKKKLGTTATQILRHLPCSALVLKKETR